MNPETIKEPKWIIGHVELHGCLGKRTGLLKSGLEQLGFIAQAGIIAILNKIKIQVARKEVGGGSWINKYKICHNRGVLFLQHP